MSDTCIVCLGDLGFGDGEVAAESHAFAKSPPGGPQEATDTALHAASLDPGDVDHSRLIAHLQPCGHDLHNECLAPWVERANSCPICRQNFHLVELIDKVGGKAISSYAVQDRTQVPDLDPSMFLELPEDDEDDQPCQACGEADNEDVLMYCDGCQKMWHTYCVDLQEVPYGHWFCDNCRAWHDSDIHYDASPRTSNRLHRRRTRGQQRRQRGHNHAQDSSWTQVWQSVWDRLNIDLDFPHDDDETSATFIRRHRAQNEANRIAHEAWLRRMRVAELQGAGGRFRESRTVLGSHDRRTSSNARNKRPSPSPVPETRDEVIAWHAFDQARGAEAEPVSRRKKRKSTESPIEVEQDEKNAAPKRRRVSKSPKGSQITSDGSSSRLRREELPRISPSPRAPILSDAAGPSFLQSLLQEVEDSSTATPISHIYRPSPRHAFSPLADHSSPRPSSPALSPLPSNHSSPRALSTTPPPPGAVRPLSPAGLSSSIQPIFPMTDQTPSRTSPEPQAEHTPQAQASDGVGTQEVVRHVIKPKSRMPRIPLHTSPPNRSRSSETSPHRPTLSLNAKQDVQKLVSAALKPHYFEQKISKDQYTAINRDISRMLYDKIGEFEALDVEGKARWEKMAGDEVNKAVQALNRQQAVGVAAS